MRACNYRLVFKKLVTTEKKEHLGTVTQVTSTNREACLGWEELC
jgi:hypothetical protein